MFVNETKTCISCGKDEDIRIFRRDSSYRDGHRDQCSVCENSPKLSADEHVYRLKEMNYGSEALRAQRWGKQQLDFEDEEARWGRVMHHSELLRRLRRICPNLYVRDGRIPNEIGLYKILGESFAKEDETYYARFDQDKPSFQYIGYLALGTMPEFSQIEFNEMDVPVKEKRRGWRTVLLKLIKAGVVTEESVKQEFGDARGIAAKQFHRQLFIQRNGHDLN